MEPRKRIFHYADDGFEAKIEVTSDGRNLTLMTAIDDNSGEIVSDMSPLRLMALREFLGNILGEIEKIEKTNKEQR